MKPPIRLLLSAALLFPLLHGCTALNDPYAPSSDGYGDPYYGSRYDSRYDYERRRELEYQRRERERIEEERERLEEERRRLERERVRHEREAYRPPPPPPPADRCPPGYSPSERKCTDKERKRGCKDLRTPGGLGCVRR